MRYFNKNLVLVKKFSLYVCLLVLSLSFMGYLSSLDAVVNPPAETTITKSTLPPEIAELKSELIKISKLKISPNATNDITKVEGTATNNNKVVCNFGFEIIYLNKNGTPFITEFIQVIDIKPGETKYFSDTLMDIDISKTTHKIQFGRFFTYKK